MLPTVLLILAATALGGVLKETGTVRRLVKAPPKVKSRGGLVLATISSCSLTLVASGNQMLAIILPRQSFRRLCREGSSSESALGDWRTGGHWSGPFPWARPLFSSRRC